MWYQLMDVSHVSSMKYSEAEERIARKILKAKQMKAAVRVQKVFRGFRIRRRMKYKRDAVREVSL